MSISYTSDHDIPVRRLQLNAIGALAAVPPKVLFVRGPIPLEWLHKAAVLPGKGLHVAIALWWRYGMANGKPFKLTQRALEHLNVKRDAASAALVRLERAGLIRVYR